MTTASVLSRLSSWYHSQCDGEWEHDFGIMIETLDNPGWRVAISLQKTTLDAQLFDTYSYNDEDDSEWIRCWVEDRTFHIACGPQQLEQALQLFLAWADGADAAS